MIARLIADVLLALFATSLLSDVADSILESKEGSHGWMWIWALIMAPFVLLGFGMVHADVIFYLLAQDPLQEIRIPVTIFLLIIAVLSHFVASTADVRDDWLDDMLLEVGKDVWIEYAALPPVSWLPGWLKPLVIGALQVGGIGMFWFIVAFLKNSGALDRK